MGTERQPEASDREPLRVPGPGRPRNPHLDDAILNAVRELLIQVGYKRLSFELIARRSGSTRPAIYRRWPSKAHVVHAAVFQPGEAGLENSGDFDQDLRKFIHSLAERLSLPVTRAAFPGLLADFSEDPTLRAEVIHEPWAAMRASFAERLRSAHECGQVGSVADGDRVIDMITGAMIQHVVAYQGEPWGYADFLADIALEYLRRS